MPKIDKLPSIAITSYLGKDKALRERRLEYHIRQLRELPASMQMCSILSICSGYSDKERSKLQRYADRTMFLEDATPKWIKHNIVLNRLYEKPDGKTACLLLDDDVIPRVPKDTDLVNGMVDTAELISFWLESPGQMAAEVSFFACMGLRFDAFYKSQKAIVVTNPPTITGWAMMARSDLGVLYTKELVTVEEGWVSVDTPFRWKCEAEGKTVIKHNRAFFKSFQSQNTDSRKDSVFYKDQEHRTNTIQAMRRHLRKLFPQLFDKKNKGTKGDDGFNLV